MVTVKEHESVITWDFDVIKGDVIFTVFRHKRPKEACSGSLTNLGESPSCGVIANVDAVVVEKPKTCHDGESVQVRKGIGFLGRGGGRKKTSRDGRRKGREGRREGRGGKRGEGGGGRKGRRKSRGGMKRRKREGRGGGRVRRGGEEEE